MRAVENLGALLDALGRKDGKKEAQVPERIFRVVNGVEVEIPARVAGKRYVATTGGTRELSDAEQSALAARASAELAAKTAQDAQPAALTMEQRMSRMEAEMLIVKARLELP